MDQQLPPFVPEEIPSIEADFILKVSNSINPAYLAHSVSISSEGPRLTFKFNNNHLPLALKFLQLCIFTLYRFKTIYNHLDQLDTVEALLQPLIRICQELIDTYDYPPDSSEFNTYNYLFQTHDLFQTAPSSENLTFVGYLVVLKTQLISLKNLSTDFIYYKLTSILYTLDIAYCMVLCYTKFFIPLNQLFQIEHNNIETVLATLNRLFDTYTVKLPTRSSFTLPRT